MSAMYAMSNDVTPSNHRGSQNALLNQVGQLRQSAVGFGLWSVFGPRYIIISRKVLTHVCTHN